MVRVGPVDQIDVAMLPLADGQQLLVPLNSLAEVQQVNFAGRPPGDLGEFSWRGLELDIRSLDGFVGLPEPAPERLSTVGVFRADKSMDPPFVALAFAGIASPGRIDEASLDALEMELDEHFLGATKMHDEVYLVPDLLRLLNPDLQATAEPES